MKIRVLLTRPNPIFRVIYCLFLFSFLAGCGQRYILHEPIDLVHSTQEAGSVLFECAGLDEHPEVIGHNIVIDDQKPIYVEAYSRLRVTVASGRHTFSIVSVSKSLGGDHKSGDVSDQGQTEEYGKPSMSSFFMVEGGAVIVNYKAPLSQNDAGQLWMI